MQSNVTPGELLVACGIIAVFFSWIGFLIDGKIARLDARLNALSDIAEQASRDARRSDAIAVDAVKIAVGEEFSRKWRSRHGI